jgi:hypothetical protein
MVPHRRLKSYVAVAAISLSSPARNARDGPAVKREAEEDWGG